MNTGPGQALDLRLGPIRTPNATAARPTPRAARAAVFGTNQSARVPIRAWRADEPTSASQTTDRSTATPPAAPYVEPAAGKTPKRDEGKRWVIRRH